MILINYSKSYKALGQFLEEYNLNQEEPSAKLRGNVIHTAKEIIRIYGVFVLRANAVEQINPKNLPPLKTNNVQLAKLTQVSSRTIQRHITRLQEAGIITDKIWHGSNAGYELWISPKILWIKGELTPNEAKIREEVSKLGITENQSIRKVGTTKCPHTEYSYNRYLKNNIIIDVENTGDLKKRCSLALTEKNENTSYTKGNVLTGNTKKEGTKNIQETKKEGQRRAERLEVSDPARCSSIENYVWLLWRLAKNTIYKEVYLTENQEKIAQSLLFQWYEPVASSKLSKVHRSYCERIGLAKKYLDKDKSRFVLLPFQYFDPTNPNGFTGTKKWQKQQLKRSQEVRRNRVLHSQVRKYLKNEEKEVHLRTSSLQLFKECETSIGKLGDSGLLDQFYASVLSAKKYNQITQ